MFNLYSSDADSDVLADYVLALLRHDQPSEDVRKLCIEQLEDFLKDRKPPRAFSPAPFANSDAPTSPSHPAYSQLDIADPRIPTGPRETQSRKRTYNDRELNESSTGRDSHYDRSSRDERAMKLPRRGGGRGGRYEGFGNMSNGTGPTHAGRGGRVSSRGGMDTSMGNASGLGALPPSQPLAFQGIASVPPAFPFDPNDPMGTFMAMNTMMGLPPLPGLPFPPTVPLAGPDTNTTTPGRPILPKTKERCKDYDQKGVCALGGTCPYEHGVDHIVIPGTNAQGDEYDPTTPSIMTDASTSPTQLVNGNGNGNGFYDRNSRNSASNGDRGRGQGRGRGDRGNFASRRGNRADFSSAGPNHDRSITSVVVENIPEEKFEADKVREFFSEFGTIEDIQMQAYKRLAVIKFSDWSSARRAYESPKVIFDNRFVKVYWYKPDSIPVPPPGFENKSGNAGVASSSSPTNPSLARDSQIDIEEFKKKQDILQKAHEEKQRKIKEAETAQRELEKRKEELSKSQAEEMGRLAQREAAMKGSRKASDASAAPGTLGTPGVTENGTPNTSGREETALTKALKAQLAALEAEALSLGIDAKLDQPLSDIDPWASRGRGRARGFYRGRGAYVPRGRGFDPSRGSYRARGGASFGRGGGGISRAFKLDNRTKKVSVSAANFDSSKDEGLREYLLSIGEFENIEPNPSRPDSQIITFKDRSTAERFMYGPTELPSIGKVELSWVNTPSAASLLPSSTTNPLPAPSKAPSPAFDTPMQDTHEADAIKQEDYDVAEDDDRWID
ncbi:MAG: hypothetical protein M1829_005593 [Trizodia sp. TS-e1964]|nr:MAG: hypothetical protein M1829_005593 [Trizodia sp. TS-e1964]